MPIKKNDDPRSCATILPQCGTDQFKKALFVFLKIMGLAHCFIFWKTAPHG